MTKFDYAATLVASLAALLIRQQDAVGLALVDRASRVFLRPRSVPTQLTHVVETLSRTVPEGPSHLGEVMGLLADKMKRRGLVIIVSDLLVDLDAFYEGLDRLQFSGHEVLVFHVLDKDEIDLPFDGSVIFHDMEGPEEVHAEPWAFRKDYQAAMADFIDGVRQRCQWAGIDYRRLLTHEDLGTALSYYLHQRQKRAVRPAIRTRAARPSQPAAQDR